ncbi:hypothetical protein DSO57_1015485 [Entomophthora muscae]|uniref:Uncharacterized protein n=1 Tax=Entomophthora muscae TaxID=34485 RepID=A0ACC2TG81_9FUNG|nr:hypothetical protein DSO57_1015485 [Entomophthora muscae]
MVNHPKQVRKPVVKYTDQTQQRVTTNHVNSKKTNPKEPPCLPTILEPKEKDNFDEILGDEINISLPSSYSGSAYQPSTPSNNVMCSSIVTPKRSLKPSTQPDQVVHSISSSQLTRLQDLNAKDIPNTTAIIQEDQYSQYMDMDLHVCWDSIPRL